MHRKVWVCSLHNRQEYIIVERFPRLSWEPSLFCIILLYNQVEKGWEPVTQWLSPYNLNEFIEYTISEEASNG